MLYLFILVLMILVAGSPASGGEVFQLSAHPTWHKLLHLDPKTHQSKVISNDFFLEKSMPWSEAKELQATIAVLKQGEKQRQTVMCQFPARYKWLSNQLKLPSIDKDLKHCIKLKRWLGNNDEVSLILVSGYLGNPASTFGHALLKLQSAADQDKNKLMDAAVNYGAVTPKDEPTLKYVYKGLFGGYEATYLDQYYHTQELMYSRLESRDMWEYKLNLSREQSVFLMFHIWELLGKKFRYYFLDENCAYQLMDLLQLVIDDALVPPDVVWYVPAEGFRRLEALDKKYKKQGKEGLIKSKTFLPSSQRKLNYQLAQLNETELAVMRSLMQEDALVDVPTEIKDLSQTSKMHILDAGLSYYNYRLIQLGLKSSEANKRLKRQVLLARFALPVEQVKLAEVPYQASPTQSSAPFLFGAGIAYASFEKSYLRFHSALYHQDSSGNNNLRGDELVLFDGSMGVAGQQHDIFLESFDFIRIRKLNNNRMLVRSDEWAWQMRFGLQKERKKNGLKYDGLFSFGVGKTVMLNGSVSLYGMIDGSMHSVSPNMRIKPTFGIYFDASPVKGLFSAGIENEANTKGYVSVFSAEVQYHASDISSIVYKYDQKVTSVSYLEMRWFW